MSTKALKKELLAAVIMLLVAAVALSGSTYAWFAMNTEVKASNMQVKAKAEQGLLINEIATAADTNWDVEATTAQTAGKELFATSTANTTAWYVAYSKLANNSASATQGAASANLTSSGYTTLSLTTAVDAAAAAGSNAKREVGFIDGDGESGYTAGDKVYFVKYTYYLKSSADEIALGTTAGAQNLNIKDVQVAGNSTSAALDAALRVAVVVNNKAYIYAPVSGATGTYYVNASSTATTVLTGAQPTDLATIPATTADGTPVYVYLYFEGEDANLKTENITSTLDNLTVAVTFALATNSGAVTVKGVAL